MATVMQVDAVKELQDSFQLLIKNWMLALPTAIASLLQVVLFTMVFGAAIAGVFAGGILSGQNPGLAGALLGGVGLIGLVGGIVVLLVSLVAHATVIAGAQGGQFDLSPAASRAFSKLPQLVIAAILIFLMTIIPCLLILLAGLGLLLLIVLFYFTMYVMPSIVVGDRTAIEAIKESFNIAKSTLQPSIIAFLGIAVGVLVASFLSGVFLHIWGLNLIIGFAVGGFAYAYAATVIVRFYELGKSAGSAVSPPATPRAPAP